MSNQSILTVLKQNRCLINQHVESSDPTIIENVFQQKLYIQQIEFADFCGYIIENKFNTCIDYQINMEQNQYLLYYQLSGNCFFRGNEDRKFGICKGLQFYSYEPQQNMKLSISGKTCLCYIRFNCKNKQYYPNEISAHFHDMIIDKEHLLDTNDKVHPFPITPMMKICIDNIFRSERIGFFLKLHVQSQYLQLLLLHLEQMDNHNCNVFCSLPMQDMTRLLPKLNLKKALRN